MPYAHYFVVHQHTCMLVKKCYVNYYELTHLCILIINKRTFGMSTQKISFDSTFSHAFNVSSKQSSGIAIVIHIITIGPDYNNCLIKSCTYINIKNTLHDSNTLYEKCMEYSTSLAKRVTVHLFG